MVWRRAGRYESENFLASSSVCWGSEALRMIFEGKWKLLRKEIFTHLRQSPTSSSSWEENFV